MFNELNRYSLNVKSVFKGAKKLTFLTAVLFLLAFQFVGYFMVKVLEPGAVSDYILNGAVCFISMVGMSFYTAYNAGSVMSCLILGILMNVGVALQATLGTLGTRTAIIYVLSFTVAFTALAFEDKLLYKQFIQNKKLIIAVAAALGVCIGIMVLLGSGQDGTRSWIYIGSFSFQITEIIKVLTVFLLAIVLSRRFDNSARVDTFKKLLYGTLIVAVVVLSLAFASEFGTVLIVGLTYLAMAFVFLRDRKLLWAYLYLLIAFAAAACCLVVIIHDRLEESPNALYYAFDKVIRRVMTCFSFSEASSDDIYQVVRSQRAIAQGGFFGSSTNYNEIVHPDTDMIFSYLCLRLGAVSGLAVLGLYLMFYVKTYNPEHTDGFRLVLSNGLNTMVMLQSVIMILSGTNFLPLTGLGLPLLSRGGTSLVITVTVLLLLVKLTFTQDNKMIEKREEGVDYDEVL